MPNVAHLLGVGGHRHEVAGHRGVVAQRIAAAHFRALWALVIVSRVVKVLEAMMNRVSPGRGRS